MPIGTTAAIVVGVGLAAKAGASIHASNVARNAQDELNTFNKDMLKDNLEYQLEQGKILQQLQQEYKDTPITNPYANLQNRFADLDTTMENPMEDLRVSTQAAEFQAEQGAQQRATILDSLRGAAGGSGIAGLAQAMANQGTLQARQIAADISQQEVANERASAQAAMSIAQQGMQLELAKRQGAQQVDMTRMGGEAMVQEAQLQRQATLLGMQQGIMAGANQAVQQSYANQMSGMMAGAQMDMQVAGMYGDIGGDILSAGVNMGTTYMENNP